MFSEIGGIEFLVLQIYFSIVKEALINTYLSVILQM